MSYKYCLAVYMESFKEETLITYVPLEKQNIEKGLNIASQEFFQMFPKDILTNMEHRLYTVSKLSLTQQDTLFCLVLQGKYKGQVVIHEHDEGLYSYILNEDYNRVKIRKSHLVSLPSWDFESNCWK